MKRITLMLGAFFLLAACTAQAAAPERKVEGNRLISKRDPAATITLPRGALYLGADRWDLYGIADAELHVFIEPHADKSVKALYWIQFEQYLPDNTHIYNYSNDEAVTAWGLPFWQRARFGPDNPTPRAGSDLEHVKAMVERAGYRMPAESMNVRLVHLLGDERRKELMFIYAEDLAPSGRTVASLQDGDQPRPEWRPLEKALVARAKERIRLEMN